MSESVSRAAQSTRAGSARPCALLAAWGSAWLQGAVAFDDVLDAVGVAAVGVAVSGIAAGEVAAGGVAAGGDVVQARHVAGPGFAPGTGHPVGAALTDWRRSASELIRVALPVPGDVRGLGGSNEFRTAALDAGQAAFGNGFGITVLAGRRTPSSAAPELVWQRSEVAVQPADHVSLADAEHDLTEAIRESASELARRGSTSWLTDVAGPLSDARRAGERLNLPPSHPPRAVRLIAQAERLNAVLALVDAAGAGELTAADVSKRAQTLAPLRLGVRRALLAGYNAAEEVDSNRA